MFFYHKLLLETTRSGFRRLEVLNLEKKNLKKVKNTFFHEKCVFSPCKTMYNSKNTLNTAGFLIFYPKLA